MNVVLIRVENVAVSGDQRQQMVQHFAGIAHKPGHHLVIGAERAAAVIFIYDVIQIIVAEAQFCQKLRVEGGDLLTQPGHALLGLGFDHGHPGAALGGSQRTLEPGVSAAQHQYIGVKFGGNIRLGDLRLRAWEVQCAFRSAIEILCALREDEFSFYFCHIGLLLSRFEDANTNDADIVA